MTKPETSMRPLIEVTVAAPADEVWKSLRDPARIHQWFGWDAETLAAEIEYIFLTHGVPDEARRVLGFDEDVADYYQVEARGDHSVVRFIRPAPAEGSDWDDIFEDVTQGWVAYTQQLKFALDRHPGQDRRTIFLSGTPHPGKPLARQALGLPTSEPGARYAITAPMGDALAGTVWHRRRHQVGVTVDGVGDGLLVVMDRPIEDKYPTGHTQIILTTYGLDDRAFAELEARWRTWFDAHFTSAMPGCT